MLAVLGKNALENDQDEFYTCLMSVSVKCFTDMKKTHTRGESVSYFVALKSLTLIMIHS